MESIMLQKQWRYTDGDDDDDDDEDDDDDRAKEKILLPSRAIVELINTPIVRNR